MGTTVIKMTGSLYAVSRVHNREEHRRSIRDEDLSAESTDLSAVIGAQYRTTHDSCGLCAAVQSTASDCILKGL